LKKTNSEIILGFYFYQKRSFLTDLRSITWFFKTSFKTTYFNTVFKLFLGRYHSKKIWKQHFSTKLDKGFRLVYELSYLVEKKFLVSLSFGAKCLRFFFIFAKRRKATTIVIYYIGWYLPCEIKTLVISQFYEVKVEYYHYSRIYQVRVLATCVCDSAPNISLKPTMKPQLVAQIICPRVLDLKKQE
jgi:hypothetical protein